MAESQDKVSLSRVMEVLRTVKDPASGRDLLTLNRVRDLRIEESGRVTLKLHLDTTSEKIRTEIEGSIRNAIQTVAGVTALGIQVIVEEKAAHAAQAPGMPGVKWVVAVSSGKGGVGKSTVSVNLATSLALDGFRVGLLDADIHGPNLPLMMGVTESPQIIEKEGGKEFFVPPMAHGVKVLSMGSLVNPDQALIWRGPMLHQAMQQFARQVEWGELDFVIIDMPPGTGDVQLSLAQLIQVNGAVLVTTPQEAAAQDVRRAYFMWDKVKIPIIGVVENMSYFVAPDTGNRYEIFGRGAGEALARKFGTKLLGQFPIESNVRAGGDEGRPIVLRDPSTPAAVELRAFARRVADWVKQSTQVQSAEIQIGSFQ